MQHAWMIYVAKPAQTMPRSSYTRRVANVVRTTVAKGECQDISCSDCVGMLTNERVGGQAIVLKNYKTTCNKGIKVQECKGVRV